MDQKIFITFILTLLITPTIAQEDKDYTESMILEGERVESPQEGERFSLGNWRFKPSLWQSTEPIEVERLSREELPEQNNIVLFSGIAVSGDNIKDVESFVPSAKVSYEKLYRNNLLAGARTTYGAIYKLEDDGNLRRLDSHVRWVVGSISSDQKGEEELNLKDNYLIKGEDNDLEKVNRYFVGGNPEGFVFDHELPYESPEGECETFDRKANIPDNYTKLDIQCGIIDQKDQVSKELDDLKNRMPGEINERYSNQYERIRGLIEDNKPEAARLRLDLLKRISASREKIFRTRKSIKSVKESDQELENDYESRLKTFEQKIEPVEDLPMDRVIALERNERAEVRKYSELSSRIEEIQIEVEEVEEEIEDQSISEFRDKCYDRRVGSQADAIMDEESMRSSLNLVKIKNSSLPEVYTENYSRTEEIEQLFERANRKIDQGNYPDATEIIRKIEGEVSGNEQACEAIRAKALFKDIKRLNNTEKLEENQLETLMEARTNLNNREVKEAESKVEKVSNQVKKNYLERLLGPMAKAFENLVETFEKLGNPRLGQSVEQAPRGG